MHIQTYARLFCQLTFPHTGRGSPEVTRLKKH